MPRRPLTAKTTRDQDLKTQLLAVKLRMEQVKLRQLEVSLPSRHLGALTPLSDDTLVHLRLPPELNLEKEFDCMKLAYARELGLAPPAEDNTIVEPKLEARKSDESPAPDYANMPVLDVPLDELRGTDLIAYAHRLAADAQAQLKAMDEVEEK